MSAYMVSKNHMNAILTMYQKITGLSDARLTQIGAMLFEQNALSVAYRYDEPPETYIDNEYVFEPSPEDLLLIEAIKLCDCLEYQSFETDDYFKTEAFNLLYVIKGTFVCKLPGYEQATWSLG